MFDSEETEVVLKEVLQLTHVNQVNQVNQLNKILLSNVKQDSGLAPVASL